MWLAILGQVCRRHFRWAERAADYISGQWAHAYGLPDMPVDGVLIGTAAMTAKEAHTSPEVKQLLVKTPGIPPSPTTCSPRRPPTGCRPASPSVACPPA